jgi:CheY-like chemotaxis protein
MPRAKSVLIVDDDEEYRNVMREVLEAEGCTVFSAPDGKAALKVLEVVHPDLLVVDLVMPVMNGWEFCAAVEKKRELADIPLVVLSSNAAFHPSGVTRALSKPVGLATLISLLDIVDAPDVARSKRAAARARSVGSVSRTKRD